jgi:hypothetical protein
MLVYGLIVNFMNKFAFLLFISSFTIVFGQNQNQILLLLMIHFDADEFWGMIFGFIIPLKTIFF